jgi:hypothetical protein
MIWFTPCEQWHIPLIKPQDVQVGEISYAAAQGLVENSFALSCWVDSQCVAAAGIHPIWNGRAEAWSLLGSNSGPALVAITKKLRFVLATWPANRIEMTVRESFGPGCRLAALLGFRAEARLPSFFPDGSTAYLFTLLKHVQEV